MKTLEGHTLIYDGACPLCKAYTSVFVNTGMLDEQGRMAYTCENIARFPSLDRDRARNEIALVNRANGEVTYGVKSIMEVIGNSMPVFKPLFRNSLFFKLASKAYSLVSYNRKVIVPGSSKTADSNCEPDLNVKYRMAFIVLAWLVVATILRSFSELLVPKLEASTYGREFLICGGQILFQGLLLLAIRRNVMLDYIGNMMTVSLIGGLALLPLLLIASLIHVSPIFALGYFGLVVAGMLVEHYRRCKLLGLGLGVSLSWVGYRCLVLIFIL